MQKTELQRHRRHARIRSRVSGTAARPRLCVFRSNTHIYAQLIDDESKTTLISSSDMREKSGTKTERAAKVGVDLATKAKAAKITTCVFDRGGYKYHGRVQALAEAARNEGLTF